MNRFEVGDVVRISKPRMDRMHTPENHIGDAIVKRTFIKHSRNWVELEVGSNLKDSWEERSLRLVKRA